MARDEPGYEPDYRFSLANERTLLAWIRTSFGLIALGVPLAGGVHGLTLPRWHSEIGLGAIALSLLIIVAAFRNWRRAQVAMRLGVGLPRNMLPAVLAGGVGVLTAATLLGVVFR
jgi:putative membrane protein